VRHKNRSHGDIVMSRRVEVNAVSQ
jgi:hypothetical protein